MNTVNKIIDDFNQYYASNDLDKAIKLLEENQYQFDAANYYFFLGSALAKKGNLPQARYSLEKSLTLGNVDPKLINNLDFVTQNLELEQLEETDSFKDFLLITSSKLSPQFFLTCVLVIILLAAIFYKRLNLFLKIIIVVSLVVLAGIKFFVKHNLNFCIALEEHAIFEGPSAIFTEITKLPAGLKFIKGETSGDFVYIEFPSRFHGWVKNVEKGCLNQNE